MLNGANRKNRNISKQIVLKETVYNNMLVYLHAVGFSQEVKTGLKLGKRWDHYYTKYKNALEVKINIGGGINEIE